MHVFDILLVGMLIWIAVGSLNQNRLFKSVVMLIIFGLFMAIAWIRLGSPDVALAEAAIGAGVTGALMLDAVGHLRERATPYPLGPEAAEDADE